MVNTTASYTERNGDNGRYPSAKKAELGVIIINKK